MFPLDDPACCCRCSHTFVGRNEYRGEGGCNGAVSISGKGVLEPCGALGNGGLRGLVLWELGPSADWPGLGAIVGGWARLTMSSLDELDLLSDSGIWQSLNGARIDCINFDSFTGNQDSLNFTSWEILKH